MAHNLMEQLASPENLLSAWRAVRGNVPRRRRDRSSGPDGVSLADFERDLQAQISTLQDMLLKGRYTPKPPAKFNIAKKGGGQRTICVLTIRDRVAQRAAQQVLEPLWEPVFLPCSYGYRPGLSVEDAASQVLSWLKAGNPWIVDGDILSCFDTLNHDLLLKFLRRKVNDQHVLKLVTAWLDAGILQAGIPGELETAAGGAAGSDSSILRRSVDWAIRLAAEELGVPVDAPGEPGIENFDAAGLASSDWQYRDLAEEEAELRRRTLRKLASTGVALGASWAAPAVASYGRKAAERLNTPAGRRAIQKGALVSGGLALTAALAAASSYLLKRKAGPAPAGVLQGSPLSPLLANIYLHAFDKEMTRRGHHLVRFADDWVVCCPSKDSAEQAFNDAIAILARLHLKINPEKTHILPSHEALEWLGMRIR